MKTTASKNPPPALRAALIGLMTVVLIVCSLVSLPLSLPITLQSAGVYLGLRLLGGKDGTAAVLCYLLLGAAGLPVFASFSSGVGHLLGPTGGFLFGFLLMGVVYILSEKFTPHPCRSAVALCIGTLVCYLTGAVWLWAYGALHSTPLSLWDLLLVCAPCIIPDLIKLAASLFLSSRLEPLIRKALGSGHTKG